MCYFLYIASPLTLSEVRSMLPAGLTAELAPTPDHQILKTIHPPTQSVLHILAGRCSCDLIRPRLPDPLKDERHLRERYRQLGLARQDVIKALERHRRGGPRVAHVILRKLLANFVAEHARNAGPTLYQLHFSAPSRMPWSEVRHVSVGEIVAAPDGWLIEGSPTVVARS